MASNPTKRPSSSIALLYDVSSALLAEGIVPAMAALKKLRRMPHLFCRVLELPLHSDSPVVVRETNDRFTFAVAVSPNLFPQHIFAEVVEMVPGITKVRIGGAHRLRTVLDELDLPPWRFRLPACCVAEASTATYENGTLFVTVPKTSSKKLNEEADLQNDNHEIDQKEDGGKIDRVTTTLDLEKDKYGIALQDKSKHVISSTDPRPVDVSEGQHSLNNKGEVNWCWCKSFIYVNLEKGGAELGGKNLRVCQRNLSVSPPSSLNAVDVPPRVYNSTSYDDQGDKFKENAMKWRSNHFVCHPSLFTLNHIASETINSTVWDEGEEGEEGGLEASLLQTWNLSFVRQRDLWCQPFLWFSRIETLVW